MFKTFRTWAEFVKLAHTIFALPFALASMVVAARAYALAESGEQYAAYFFDPSNAASQTMSLTLLLPAGTYRAEWIGVLSGKPTKKERIKSPGAITIASDEFRRETSLRIKRD